MELEEFFVVVWSGLKMELDHVTLFKPASFAFSLLIIKLRLKENTYRYRGIA